MDASQQDKVGGLGNKKKKGEGGGGGGGDWDWVSRGGVRGA